jgi:hypothetical protein
MSTLDGSDNNWRNPYYNRRRGETLMPIPMQLKDVRGFGGEVLL